MSAVDGDHSLARIREPRRFPGRQSQTTTDDAFARGIYAGAGGAYM
jgi:hypothetical protein